MTIGAMEITPDVKTRAKLLLYSVVNFTKRVETVRSESLVTKVFAKVNSFQQERTVSNMTVIIIDLARGSVMRRKAVSSVQPSTFADSSSSRGMPSKNVRSKSSLKGILLAAYTMIRLRCVLLSPIWLNR